VRVLILGGRAPVALDHARRFAAQGWSVYVADSVSCRISAWSRAVAATFRLPPPRDALPAFARSLAEIINRERIDLVLPTCEETFYLSRIRHRLPALCNVFAAPFDLLGQLHSKWRFVGLAREAGLPVPDSIRISELEQARHWAGQRPIILKPEFSRFGVHVRIYRQGMPECPAPLPQQGRWVAQLFEAGREICSYSIVVRGRLQAHVAYAPTYRLHGSSSYYFEPIRVDAIESHVERFVARIGFTGQISFDWIERAADDFVALECNPRAISGLHLFGVAQPLPAAIGANETVRISGDSATPRMLAPVMITAGLQNALRTGTARKWQHDWARATDVLSAPGDVRPTLGAIQDILAFARLSLQYGCTVRAAATRDIEWDGQPLTES
jgi:hypothetical protein